MGGTFALHLAAAGLGLATACFYGFPDGTRWAAVNAPAPLTNVQQMRGPIRGFWGARDEGIDLASVRRLEAGLRERGEPCEMTVYPDAGHGFMAADVPEAADAWRSLVGFLAQIDERTAR